MSIPATPVTAGQQVAGKVSWFGGPNDAETGNNKTALGLSTSVPGIAVYNRATLGGFWKVTANNGKTAILKQTDLGPAPFTGRAIDVTYSALGKFGYNEGNFPTDSTFKATYLGQKMPTGPTATTVPGAVKADVLKPATTQAAPSLDLPAFREAEQKVAANRFVADSFGSGGAGNPLKGLLNLSMPSPSEFQTKGAPATAQPTGPAGNLAAPPEASKALSAAITQLGTPYKWGGETEKIAFDCSGLTQWAYRAAGIAIPRTAQEQYSSSHAVTGQPQPGDLVFFGSGPNNVTHVEMVVGGGKMIGADHSGTNVRYENLPAVGSRWGEDKVLGIGTPTGQPAGTPHDAAVAPSSGSVVASYHAPTGEPRAIVHHTAGKVEHVASSLPVGHQYQGGDVLGMPLTTSGQEH